MCWHHMHSMIPGPRSTSAASNIRNLLSDGSNKRRHAVNLQIRRPPLQAKRWRTAKNTKPPPSPHSSPSPDVPRGPHDVTERVSEAPLIMTSQPLPYTPEASPSFPAPNHLPPLVVLPVLTSKSIYVPTESMPCDCLCSSGKHRSIYLHHRRNQSCGNSGYLLEHQGRPPANHFR